MNDFEYLLPKSIHHCFGFYFYEVFSPDKFSPDHRIGGLNVFKSLAICAGDRFPIIYISDAISGPR